MARALALPPPPSVVCYGPLNWTYLHVRTLLYPDAPSPEARAAEWRYLNAYADTFPCGRCRPHLQQMVAAADPEAVLRGRQAYAEWMVDAHNAVNRRLGKRELDYAEVRAHWDALLGAETDRCPLRAIGPGPGPGPGLGAGGGGGGRAGAGARGWAAAALALGAALLAALGVGAWLWARARARARATGCGAE